MTRRSVYCVFDEHYKAKTDTRIAGVHGYGIYIKYLKILKIQRTADCVVNKLSKVKKIGIGVVFKKSKAFKKLKKKIL